MTRRFIALIALTIALLVFGAATASAVGGVRAANGNILCLYAKDPKPGVGLCIGL